MLKYTHNSNFVHLRVDKLNTCNKRISLKTKKSLQSSPVLVCLLRLQALIKNSSPGFIYSPNRILDFPKSRKGLSSTSRKNVSISLHELGEKSRPPMVEQESAAEVMLFF